jgi:hypothetical protein
VQVKLATGRGPGRLRFGGGFQQCGAGRGAHSLQEIPSDHWLSPSGLAFPFKRRGEYGTDGINGTDGKAFGKFPSVPFIPSVPYSLLLSPPKVSL